MTKVDIFSGFLGAGKTTLIKKLIREAYRGEKLVVIENEFGKVGIDGGFLREAGIEITEMNSGCICCSLVGDFGEALKKVKAAFEPDRILIEPSGVGKLSDVIRAVQNAGVEGLTLNAFTVVIDASKCRMYMKNFAEFYRNQIEFASSVVLSRTDGLRPEKLKEAVDIVRSINTAASLITTPWDQLDGRVILETMENHNTLEAELQHLLEEQRQKEAHHHHHHHEDDEGEEEHGHRHHDDGECDDLDCECHHHEDEDEHEHRHAHGHRPHDDGECDDPDCECHHHHEDEDDDEDGEDEHGHHHHHHDHDADEVFSSWGIETSDTFTADFVENCLDELLTGRFGMVLRAKGILPSDDGRWIHFDYVPGEKDIRFGAADVIGKLCVIGSALDKQGLAVLFRPQT